MKLRHLLLLCLCSAALITSCSDDDSTDDGGITDYSDILTNTGEDVITATYEDLANKAQALLVATQALEASPSSTALEAARNAWIAARSPWESSEGFLFGPVDQEGLDPSLDSWPVNVIDLNNLLSSNESLSIDFLAQQEGTLKGFHTIEFLLWGENGDKTTADFSQRQYEYLSAATGALAQDAQSLYNLWNPASGNYVSNLITAGSGGSIYISQKAALEELAEALVIIADEVGNAKINDPFAQSNLSLEESRFSNNSKADFSDNIRSIRNVYTGVYFTSGNGRALQDIVAAQDPALDVRVISQIQSSIDAIEGITGTFSEAVFNHRDEVQAAQTTVRDLLTILQDEVKPLISNL